MKKQKLNVVLILVQNMRLCLLHAATATTCVISHRTLLKCNSLLYLLRYSSRHKVALCNNNRPSVRHNIHALLHALVQSFS